MMNKYELEVLRMGGEKLIEFVRKEFPAAFTIIARTDEMFVLGDGAKNVKFSREKMRVMERFFFDNTRKLSRKGVLE